MTHHWTVLVRDPMNTTTLARFVNGIDDATGKVAIRGFDPAIVKPPCTSKSLNLYARQDVAQIPPRAIVQLFIDYNEVFWGPVIISPPIITPGSGPADRDGDALERITVVGGEQLLRDSIVGPRMFEDPIDVADVALELCTRYAHPALTINAGNFPATGGMISIFYAPERDLFTVLTQLAEAAPGTIVCVSPSGRVRFFNPATSPVEDDNDDDLGMT